jgi:hypothetical protein
VAQGGDEGAVDLQLIEWQLVQANEPGESPGLMTSHVGDLGHLF